MSIADEYAIIVQDTIKDRSQRYQVLQSFLKSRKEIVFISLEQMEYFAANALQVKSTGGQRFLVMSETGYRSLSKGQRKQIEKFNPILHTPLDTIEQNGGGSARCMIAEIFLPLRHGGIEKP